MKHKIYIIAFVFLGFLLQLFIHGIVEKWYIGLLIRDFEKYGFSLSWSTWFYIHHAGAIFLLIGGIVFGFLQGMYWWKVLYEKGGSRDKKKRRAG